jgi:hypothetical protein
MRSTSAVGMVLYFATMTIAAVDWAMSLEPHWFSTMYGFLFVIGQALMGLSVAIVVARRLSVEAPMSAVYHAGHFTISASCSLRSPWCGRTCRSPSS